MVYESNYRPRPRVAYDDELMHYGVVGMRWGKRKSKYQDRAEYHRNKIGSSKTRLGKNYHNYRAYRNEYKSSVGNAVTKDKGNGLKQLDNLYGHNEYAARQKAASNYYNRKSEYSKTRLGKTINASRGYNNDQWAKQNTNLRNATGVKDYAKKYVNAAVNTKQKSWSGRDTTTGRRMVDGLLTGGAAGAALDFIHYVDSEPEKPKKSKKSKKS